MLTNILGIVFAVSVFGQLNPTVDGPHIDVPGPHLNTSSPSVTTNSTTNVFPAPSREEVIATEGEAAPIIITSGFRSLDSDAASNIGDMFQVALGFASFRRDLILLPAVQEINQGMRLIVISSMGMVVAALTLWGIIARFVGSDVREAFEHLIRVPLWCILALTSIQWYGLVLDFFGALSGVVATAGQGAFGPTLRPDFWSNVGLNGFAVFVGLFMFILMLLFLLQFFANTAFLAFCAVVAPVFVFLKVTPWTQHLGSNWFKMVPATAGDTIAMLAVLEAGAVAFNRVTGATAFATVCMDIGLLMCLPLIRRLFGLEHGSAGSRLFSGFLMARALRGMRSTAAAATTKTASTATHPTTPTRSPRRAPRRQATATP